MTTYQRDRLDLDHPSYWERVVCPTETATSLNAPDDPASSLIAGVPITSVEPSLMLSQLETISPKAEAHLRTIIYEECARSREPRGSTP